MKLSGRTAVENVLTAVGERLAHAGEPCAIVIAGGAAMNLLSIVDRPTIDVDVLAQTDSTTGAIRHPDPLPSALCRAIAAVARPHLLQALCVSRSNGSEQRACP